MVRTISLFAIAHSLLTASSSVSAIVFNDGFEDGAFDDGAPVTWTPTAPGLFDASSGDLRITATPESPDIIGADVVGVVLEDTSIRSQLRVGQTDSFVALTARNQPESAGGYFGGVFTGEAGNTAFMGLNDGMGGTPFFGGEVPIDLDATQSDVMVQLDVIGTSISLRVWALGEPIPQDPIISVDDSTWMSGAPGIAMTSGDNAVYDFRRVVVADDVLGEIPGPVSARLNTLTGAVYLQVNPDSEAEIVSYEFRSPSGSLNPVGWEIGNLSARGVDVAGDGTGEGWSTVFGGRELVIEGFLLGSSRFAHSREEPIGLAYNIDADPRDVTFRIATASGEVLPGVVEYFEEAPISGDFDLDRDVDAVDYHVWQNAFGLTGHAGPDGNGDRIVNAADYTVWRDAFDAASANTIPEPTTATLLILAVIGGRMRRRAFVRMDDAA